MSLVASMPRSRKLTDRQHSTARLDEIASTLANLTAFVQDTESLVSTPF